MRLNINNDPGLNFKTPNLMKIVCKQITMIEDDSQHSQVMAITAINEEDKFKHKEYKFSGEETFPIQSNSNNHIEILLLDENNENAENTNQPKLHESFHFRYVLSSLVLSQLNLSQNRMGSQGATDLGEALKINGTLTELRYRCGAP